MIQVNICEFVPTWSFLNLVFTALSSHMSFQINVNIECLLACLIIIKYYTELLTQLHILFMKEMIRPLQITYHLPAFLNEL